MGSADRQLSDHLDMGPRGSQKGKESIERLQFRRNFNMGHFSFRDPPVRDQNMQTSMQASGDGSSSPSHRMKQSPRRFKDQMVKDSFQSNHSRYVAYSSLGKNQKQQNGLPEKSSKPALSHKRDSGNNPVRLLKSGRSK